MSGGASVLLDLLFPPRCAFCRALLRRGESGLCQRCQRELPWISGASPLWYEGAVRASFHRFKFKGRSGYAQVYGRLTAQCVRDHLSGRYDLITWVPLSPERLKKRGYDQAMLLACATALELGDVAVETLRKVRDAEAQSGLAGGAGARRANVLGAYQAADTELVAGRDHHRRHHLRVRPYPAHRGRRRRALRHPGPDPRTAKRAVFRPLSPFFLKLRLKCVGTPDIINRINRTYADIKGDTLWVSGLK